MREPTERICWGSCFFEYKGDFLPKGTKVICPKCKKHLCTVKTALAKGEEPVIEFFEGTEHYEVRDDVEPKCPDCDVYFYNSWFYIKGWFCAEYGFYIDEGWD